MRRTIGLPLTLGIVLVLLAVALAVGWHVLIVIDLRPLARRLGALHWVLLALGSLFFALLIAGLSLLCAWLLREMRLNQRQRAFLDAVTHEMKTPLASLRLSVDTLAHRDPPPERRTEFLTRMRDDLERLDRMVAQILAAARAEVHFGRRPRRSVNVTELLTRSIEDLRDRYELPPEALRLRSAGAFMVRGDSQELGLAFGNLLDNAVKYSSGRVDVQVTVQPQGDDRVRIEVEDRGVGIPRRELRRIFQPFYRAGRETVRRAAGLGLGLFIVRALVRRQGGSVLARSEGPGQGSRFVVLLRAAPDASLHAVDVSREAHVANPGR